MRMLRISLIMIVILSISFVNTAYADSIRTPKEIYYFEAQANTLHELGLFDGTSDKIFTPDLGKKLTRAQGTVLIMKMFGKKEIVENLSDTDISKLIKPFLDVKRTDWFINYVAYAVQSGIFTGTSSTTWGPNEPITGKQFSKLILNEMGYKDSTKYPYNKATQALSQIQGCKLTIDNVLYLMTRN